MKRIKKHVFQTILERERERELTFCLKQARNSRGHDVHFLATGERTFEREKTFCRKQARNKAFSALWTFLLFKASFSSRKFSTLFKIQNMKIFNVF